MLNPFPIQYLSLLAYFILRFGVGIVLIHLGLRHLSHRSALTQAFAEKFKGLSPFIVGYIILAELVIGILMLFGAFTQYAAIGLALFSIDMCLGKRFLSHPSIPSGIFYFLLIFCALSLFITGAGAFAVDLPF